MRKAMHLWTASAMLAALLACAGPAMAQDGAQTPNFQTAKEFRVVRGMSPQAQACIECHKKETPGIFADWAKSGHAQSNISCIDCHLAQPGDKDISTSHEQYYNKKDMPFGEQKYKAPIAAVVTPKDCSRCHPDEVTQYSRSKHANTLEVIWKIDPWLNKGMNSDNERKVGCYACHGTVVRVDEKGVPTKETWPNVGVGRVNLDGSLGSCTSCHTRHRFSVAEARRPEACDQCHLGPDHPQIEIYEESKHGTLYHAYGDKYNFDAAPGTWTAGVDYRAPTCAACHMSGTGKVMTSHDVTERLSWETQAPLTVRPSEFAAFPAKTDWKVEREKMKDVCRQCHSNSWTDNHYEGLDKAVQEYNEVYFKPAKKKLDELYDKGLLDKTTYFDEHLELKFYELWHHEGRRARMGTMMMAPDYAWCHGFYECKHHLNQFMEEADKLEASGKPAYRSPNVPIADGDTTRPVEIFGKTQ